MIFLDEFVLLSTDASEHFIVPESTTDLLQVPTQILDFNSLVLCYYCSNA